MTGNNNYYLNWSGSIHIVVHHENSALEFCSCGKEFSAAFSDYIPGLLALHFEDEMKKP